MRIATYIVVTVFLYVVNPLLFAQGKAQHLATTNETTVRPVQVGFVPPISSAGTEAANYTNQFSLNMLAGYNGGVHGVEFGGLTNIIMHHVNGLQFAGVANLCKGNTSGAAFAGYLNLNQHNLKGVQFAGFSNINLGHARAIQSSGFLNLNKGDLWGGQLASFINVNAGNTTGFQLSGLVNLNRKILKGVQMAGLFNYAKRLHGVQLAPFNYTDSVVGGLPIGIMSVVRKGGYLALELAGSETLFGTVSYKMGVQQLYNIFSLGVSRKNNVTFMAWGYGLGSYIDVADRYGLNLDLMCYHVNENEWFTDRLNLFNQVHLMLNYKLSHHVQLFGGPSLNVVVADAENSQLLGVLAPDKGFVDNMYFRNSHSENTEQDKTVRLAMYMGVKAGIRFY